MNTEKVVEIRNRDKGLLVIVDDDDDDDDAEQVTNFLLHGYFLV